MFPPGGGCDPSTLDWTLFIHTEPVRPSAAKCLLSFAVFFGSVDAVCSPSAGYLALYKGSPALGKFYIVTDGGKKKFWHILDDAMVQLGCTRHAR